MIKLVINFMSSYLIITDSKTGVGVWVRVWLTEGEKDGFSCLVPVAKQNNLNRHTV